MCCGCGHGQGLGETPPLCVTNAWPVLCDTQRVLCSWCQFRLRGAAADSHQLFQTSPTLTLYIAFLLFVCLASTIMSFGLVVVLLTRQMRQRNTLIVRQTRHLAIVDLLYSSCLAGGWAVNLLQKWDLVSGNYHIKACRVTMAGVSMGGTAMFFVDIGMALGAFAATCSSVRTVNFLTRWFYMVWVFTLILWAPTYFLSSPYRDMSEPICWPSVLEAQVLSYEFICTAPLCFVFYIAAVYRVRGRAPGCVEVRIVRRTGLFFFSYSVALCPTAVFNAYSGAHGPSNWVGYVCYGFLPLKGLCDALVVMVFGSNFFALDGLRASSGSLGANYSVRFSSAHILEEDGSWRSEQLRTHWFFPYADRDITNVQQTSVSIPVRPEDVH